ncbi:unannotated protein [freshwater metagenome]|uniref:Unannotated protein n=1 Tax=freshwater metagenome TaxID=449393 RepID=A0A6J6M3R9_9ZZZZ
MRNPPRSATPAEINAICPNSQNAYAVRRVPRSDSPLNTVSTSADAFAAAACSSAFAGSAAAAPAAARFRFDASAYVGIFDKWKPM